jgi:hypothetical protein
MTLRRIVIFGILLVFASVSACRKKQETAILSHARMAEMLTDFYLKESVLQKSGVNTDSALTIMTHLRSAFAGQHGMADSVIDISFRYYLAHPQELDAIYETVIDSLSLREQRMSSQKAPKRPKR